MKLEYAARTETGPVRAENQDAFHVDPGLGLFVVCDGMGGHNAGLLAATLAIESVSAHISSAMESPGADLDLRALIIDAISEANRAIKTHATGDRDLMGMGTTCTLALIPPQGRAFMGHVGDSRLYLSSADDFIQLSEDHSYVQELVNCGALSPLDAMTHPQRNIITRALGLNEEVSVDTVDFEYGPGETLLLCSDGLSGCFPNERTLRDGVDDPDLDVGVNRLVDLSLTSGGRDNITGVLVRRGAS